MTRRLSKAPLGSSNRNENTRSLRLKNYNEPSPDLTYVSYQLLIDQDTDYCQSLRVWEKEGLLAQMNNALIQLCKESAVNSKRIKKYGAYPDKSKTNFPECPKHLSKSANWSALRLSGKVRVIGIIDRNIFYIVYLDRDHLFYLSPKKHT